MVNFKQILTEDNTEPNTAFLNQLRSKLPEFFTKDKYVIDDMGNEVLVESGGFDIEKFQERLRNHNVNEITDGYTLNFVGKKYAELKTGKPTTTVVIPDVKHNSQQKNYQSDNVFLTGDNLKEFGQHNLINYQVPTEYRLIEKFPKTTSGKILRNRLQHLSYKTI